MAAKKLVSYNLNGIRAALKKDLDKWLAEHQFDVVCFQETKAQPAQIDNPLFEELGYHCNWVSAVKKGYSGVGILSKEKPDLVVEGCGDERFDSEGRVIRADFGDWTIVNIYFPSGTAGGIRQDFKYEFLDHIYKWSEELRKERPNLIIVGDYNIAHTENDIHNPKSNKNNSGFLPEERAWMTKWLDSGFTDAYRKSRPEEIQYSWWSYRANARANNKGWRIDYQCVSEPIADKIVDCFHLKESVHSDHCAVVMEIEL